MQRPSVARVVAALKQLRFKNDVSRAHVWVAPALAGQKPPRPSPKIRHYTQGETLSPIFNG